jgi:hypothetical protein
LAEFYLEAPSIVGGVDLRGLGRRKLSPKALQRLPIRTRPVKDNGEGPDMPARLEISITRVAQELRLEA